MKHYFGYRADGSLASVETHAGGWPADRCMSDLACDHPVVTKLRAVRADSSPDIIGFIGYDCDCPSEDEVCDCLNDFFAGHYVNTSTQRFIAKPGIAVVVGGTQIESGGVVTRAPGVSVTLKVVSPGSPDGTTLTFSTKGNVEISAEPSVTLTFTGGETQTINLVAPAQGSRGQAFIIGKLARPYSFWLRGFAT
jgi:hypothetical protein